MSPIALPGFHSPGASTEAPLEMLAACHGRVHKQCETLGRLAAHLPTHGSDTAAQQAATAVMRYFDTAARDHHADEEEDLFPALLDAMAAHAREQRLGKLWLHASDEGRPLYERIGFVANPACLEWCPAR